MEDAILTKLLDYGTLGILAGVFIYISISLYRKYEAKNEQIINKIGENKIIANIEPTISTIRFDIAFSVFVKGT